MSDDTETKHRQLLERVGRAIRRQGALSVVMSAAIAARFGLDPRALECLDLILLRGSASAGELAKAAGLSTGATTALIDRLEKAGYVARGPDPNDRRRVVVTVRTEAVAPIAAVYEPIKSASFALWDRFSDEELEIVERFLSSTADLAETIVESFAKPRASRSK